MIPTSVFEQKWARVLVVVICALVFGAIHYATNNQILAAVGGLYLGVIFLATKNPLLCMIGHATMNLSFYFKRILCYHSVKVSVSIEFPTVVLHSPNTTCITLIVGGVFILVGGGSLLWC